MRFAPALSDQLPGSVSSPWPKFAGLSSGPSAGVGSSLCVRGLRPDVGHSFSLVERQHGRVNFAQGVYSVSILYPGGMSDDGKGGGVVSGRHFPALPASDVTMIHNIDVAQHPILASPLQTRCV